MRDETERDREIAREIGRKDNRQIEERDRQINRKTEKKR